MKQIKKEKMKTMRNIQRRKRPKGNYLLIILFENLHSLACAASWISVVYLPLKTWIKRHLILNIVTRFSGHLNPLFDIFWALASRNSISIFIQSLNSFEILVFQRDWPVSYLTLTLSTISLSPALSLSLLSLSFLFTTLPRRELLGQAYFNWSAMDAAQRHNAQQR